MGVGSLTTCRTEEPEMMSKSNTFRKDTRLAANRILPRMRSVIMGANSLTTCRTEEPETREGNTFSKDIRLAPTRTFSRMRSVIMGADSLTTCRTEEPETREGNTFSKEQRLAPTCMRTRSISNMGIHRLPSKCDSLTAIRSVEPETSNINSADLLRLAPTVTWTHSTMGTKQHVMQQDSLETEIFDPMQDLETNLNIFSDVLGGGSYVKKRRRNNLKQEGEEDKQRLRTFVMEQLKPNEMRQLKLVVTYMAQQQQQRLGLSKQYGLQAEKTATLQSLPMQNNELERSIQQTANS